MVISSQSSARSFLLNKSYTGETHVLVIIRQNRIRLFLTFENEVQAIIYATNLRYGPTLTEVIVTTLITSQGNKPKDPY